MKTNRFVATGILAMFLVTGSGAAFAAPAGNIGQGNISVYKGGQLADKFTGLNPVEDEALLVCDGKCMIKSPGISLIGSDGAKLAIKKEQDIFNLFVREGHVEFVVTDSIRQIAFHTPDGQYTIADVMFNAGANAPVKGYMDVNAEGQSEIGVREGRMVFATAEGSKIVDMNNRILLAQVPPASAPGGAGTAPSGAGAAAGNAGGLGLAAFGGVVAIGAISAADNDGSDAGPSIISPVSASPNR